MKHILLLAVICFISLSAIAQPTLTAATNNPVAGDVFSLYLCDTTGFSGLVAGGPSGAGITWDFSALGSSFTGSLSFTSAAGTMYIDSFPGSNLLSIDRSGGMASYGYFTVNANYWAASGIYDSNYYVGALYYPKPHVITGYPFSYGSPATVDTGIQTGHTSNADLTFIDSNTADAYGTLIIPAGTFPNVLRVHKIELEKDSIPGLGLKYTMHEKYWWFQPDFHYLLFYIDYDTSHGNKYISDIGYYTKMPEGINTLSKNDLSLSVYPNPATSLITITCTLTDPATTTLTISDVTGRVVGTINNTQLTTGTNTISYPISNLSPGVYLIHLTSNGSSTTRKIVVER